MTEAEARTKWCSYTQHGKLNVSPPTNRSGDGLSPPPWARCLGSDCMAWKWDLSTPADDVRTGHCGRVS